jgi:hypothetical protein
MTIRHAPFMVRRPRPSRGYGRLAHIPPATANNRYMKVRSPYA